MLWAFTVGWYVTHDQNNINISLYECLKWQTPLIADGLLIGRAVRRHQLVWPSTSQLPHEVNKFLYDYLNALIFGNINCLFTTTVT